MLRDKLPFDYRILPKYEPSTLGYYSDDVARALNRAKVEFRTSSGCHKMAFIFGVDQPVLKVDLNPVYNNVWKERWIYRYLRRFCPEVVAEHEWVNRNVVLAEYLKPCPVSKVPLATDEFMVFMEQVLGINDLHQYNFGLDKNHSLKILDFGCLQIFIALKIRGKVPVQISNYRDFAASHLNEGPVEWNQVHLPDLWRLAKKHGIQASTH